MKKLFVSIFIAFFAQLAITSAVNAQTLEAWDWNKGVTFEAYTDMTVKTNNASEFEAENKNIYMFYQLSTWTYSSYEDMGRKLGEIAVEVGFPSNAEIDELNNKGLPGAYILANVEGVNMIMFAIGNDKKNVSVLGLVTYKSGYKSDALKMIRKVYME